MITCDFIFFFHRIDWLILLSRSTGSYGFDRRQKWILFRFFNWPADLLQAADLLRIHGIFGDAVNMGIDVLFGGRRL